MKLSKRLLTVLNIVILSLFLVFIYSYLNGLISYRYEVQSDEFAGNILNSHQREILQYLASSRNEALIFLGIFLATGIFSISKPEFKGKIEYVD